MQENMNGARRCCASAVVEDELFVFGGCDGWSTLSSAEAYNTKDKRQKTKDKRQKTEDDSKHANCSSGLCGCPHQGRNSCDWRIS
mmetsp:Transcript_3719/g.8321  ORF Transcript_3719/g.8321 Transcript_3719/m.8321 type:complete len:85 (+) Transcript_3719:92-346(+)